METIKEKDNQLKPIFSRNILKNHELICVRGGDEGGDGGGDGGDRIGHLDS